VTSFTATGLSLLPRSAIGRPPHGAHPNRPRAAVPWSICRR
jgi:hypothetical protein